jgi:TolB-like protein
MAPPLVSQQVFAGRYILEREIGHRGMATVYLARDLRHDRPVSLKVLRHESTATLDPEWFLREIKIGARLDHPNILALHDYGESDGRLFYVTLYVEGESLRQKLVRERQLPLADTISIVTAVARALTHAHGHGVVHRNIKPENILLSVGESTDPAVHPLVADFWIASTGLAPGTPSYMSPEQAAGGDIDGRSDIYALGCVAYEMLAGNPPFTGSTDQAILARHSVDPVPALRTVRSTVPLGVERAITRALAKAPADRFETASEFAQALAAGHIPRRIPHRAVLAQVVSAAFAVAAVAAAVWLRGSEPPVLPSAARIAVLPFLSASNDTALDRLGRDLAVTVSTSLDGVGGIETTDRTRMAAAMADRATLSPAEATALARRLGARSVLGGTLARDGPDVRIALELHDTEADTSVVRGVTVTGPSDSLRALTDSVVWALLRQVWRRGESPTPSLTAVTTQSLPALRAFLDGERNVELNRWDEAALAYRSAMEADSTFWLAYFRYSLAQYWREEPIEDEIALALFHHREVFPERDRLLVEAWAAKDTLSVYLERLEAVTRRFPDYWPGWFMLGDRLLHAGALLGHDWRQAQDAFSRCPQP